MALFKDRTDAGQHLAKLLQGRGYGAATLVLGLPRGGVPVAYEVARHLRAQLDVFIVRKLGTPGHEELAMGAIASGGVKVLNQDIVHNLAIPESAIERVAERERQELERRERLYRGDRPFPDLAGQTVLLVDDGLATGATMRAAVKALKHQEAGRIVVAVPVAAPDTCEAFKEEVDEVVCAETPQPFYGVGMWYADFSQTTDDEVKELLARNARAT
jgi:putative phosphoribosyl transferase